MIFRALLILWAISVSLPGIIKASDLYPDLPLHITSLEWTLDFDKDLSVFNAKAIYTMRVNRNDVLSFSMHQADLRIRSVKVGEREVPVIVTDDSLRIGLRESFPKGTDFQLIIDYQASINSALFISENSMYWSSGFRSNIRSLLPIIDHPRIAFKTQITALHPSEFQFVANGAMKSRNRINDTRTSTSFLNRSAIPVSGIRVVLGRFNVEETQVGVIPIRLYISSADSNSARNLAITRRIQSEIIRISKATRKPYALDAFHAVLLPDSYGQVWGDGAGIGYLFEDYGNLDDQLKLVVASQWLRQSLQTNDAMVEEYLSIYTQILAEVNEVSFNDPSQIIKNLLPEADGKSTFVKRDKEVYSQFKLSEIEYLLQNNRGILTLSDLEEARYQDGWLDNPLPELGYEEYVPYKILENEPQKPGFYVKIARTEVPGEVSIQFEPYGNHKKSDYSIELTTFYEKTSNKQNLMISSLGSVTIVDVGASIQNIEIESVSSQNIELNIDKPLGFWLHQYRNTSHYNIKMEAARALAVYASHQDVGALVRDEIIAKETDEYLSILFRLWSPEGLLLDDSDEVLEWLQKKLESVDRARLLNLMTQQLSIDALSELAVDYYTITSSWDVHILLLKKYFQFTDINAAITFSETYLSARYPFEVRATVFKELIRTDQNTRNWTNRLPELANDQDPRIRLLALKSADLLNQEQKTVLLRDRAMKERDPRILTYLSELTR